MSQQQILLSAILSTLFVVSIVTVYADFQPPSSNDIYQREHSLVKPYQGSGMVSRV